MMTRNRHKFLSIFLILIFIFSALNVYASDHRLESLNINVYVNEDGSARITENRIANLTEGTENYIVIENLGRSEIKDFIVYENGEAFEYVDSWNINASREEKTGKNSILTTSSGYELSWGIGEYGRHDYTLEYTITNFVKELEDSQMIFWQFVNPDTNIPPEQLEIVIESEHNFNAEEEKIWGFGFGGNIEFQDGKIVATSNGALSRQNYATVLTKLPQGMFETQDILNKNFEEIKDTAFVGSDYSEDDYETSGNVNNASSSGGGSIFSFIPIIGFGIAFIAVAGSLIMSVNSKLINLRPNKFNRKFKEEYYRDYPYEGSFLDIYYIPYMMGTTDFEGLLTGFILKWINEEKVMTVEEEKGWIFKKDETNIKFLNKDMSKFTLEGELFHMMLKAAGKNEILEESEFTKWAKSNVTELNDWEKRVKENSINKLEEMAYIEILEKRAFLFKTEKYELTEKGKELETKIYKYINYLHDFSLLNEHEAVNVTIWDNIMIWAGFLGLTEEVSRQFKKLYPRYGEETVYRGNTILLTHHLARNISQAKVTTTRSSGGGGGTSFGGGGGSFGGGSGGGTR
jgi:predicted membrane protein DUF2207